MNMGDTTGWHCTAAATAYVQDLRSFGTRGAYQLGSVNHATVAAGGSWAGGTLRAGLMASAEPLTLTSRGAPQLLQVAFSNRGTIITDHAHPSPWIMELAVSWEHALSPRVSAAVYGAAVGEPVLGPPVYLHRASAFANPAVPLGHHTEDVTHASYGVISLGVTDRPLRLELSAFNDRQPDDPTTVFFYRGGRLDAYAARASFIAAGWTVSTSYGFLPASGGGHSHGTLHRTDVALIRDVSPWFLTVVYGVNRPLDGSPSLPAVLVEGEHRTSNGHVLFARAEYVKRTAAELSLVGSVDATQDIGAVQAGYARAVASVGREPARIGAYASVALIPAQLVPFYGNRAPLTVSVYAQYSWASTVQGR